jgi:hypothetical protein
MPKTRTLGILNELFDKIIFQLPLTIPSQIVVMDLKNRNPYITYHKNYK